MGSAFIQGGQGAAFIPNDQRLGGNDAADAQMAVSVKGGVEADHALCGNGFVDLAHHVRRLVTRCPLPEAELRLLLQLLPPPLLHLIPEVDAGQGAELAEEGVFLLLTDGTAGQDRVSKKLKFLVVKETAVQPATFAAGRDIQAKLVAHAVKRAPKGLPLAGDPVVLNQQFSNLFLRDGRLGSAVLFQDAKDAEGNQVGGGDVCQITASLSRVR